MEKNCVAEAAFCGEYSTKFKRFRFVVEKGSSKKKKKNDDRPNSHQITEIQKISSSGDLNKWLFCKESQFILFERTRLKITTRKKERNSNGDRTKTVLQTRDEEMKKGFFRKHEKLMKDFSRKRINSEEA